MLAEIRGFLIGRIKAEWPTVKAAPGLCVVIAVLGAIVGAGLMAIWDAREIRITQKMAEDYKQRAGFYPDFTLYSKLTNSELKEFTSDFVRRLGELDLLFRATLRQIGEGNSQEERDASLKEYQTRIDMLQLRFNTEYRPVGLNLRAELLRRIPEEKRPERPEIPLVALDHGMLAGASPLGDTIDYLQKLADLLAE